MRRVPTYLVLSALLSSAALAQEAAPQESTSEGESRSAFRSAGGLLDRSEQTRQHQLSFFVGLPWYLYGGFPLGLGARYYFPILPNGFISSVNDEFGIEAGVDVTAVFWSYFGVRLDIPAEAMWRFHFTDHLSAYAKLGIGIGFSFNGYGCAYTSGFCAYPVPVSAVGMFYKLSDSISLRAELGYPWAKVGLAIGL